MRERPVSTLVRLARLLRPRRRRRPAAPITPVEHCWTFDDDYSGARGRRG